MKGTFDVLTVSFDSSLRDEPTLCVSRTIDDELIVVRTVCGEQADVLYRLLTDSTAKVEKIKTELHSELLPEIQLKFT